MHGQNNIKLPSMFISNMAIECEVLNFFLAPILTTPSIYWTIKSYEPAFNPFSYYFSSYLSLHFGLLLS